MSDTIKPNLSKVNTFTKLYHNHFENHHTRQDITIVIVIFIYETDHDHVWNDHDADPGRAGTAATLESFIKKNIKEKIKKKNPSRVG